MRQYVVVCEPTNIKIQNYPESETFECATKAQFNLISQKNLIGHS